MWWLFFVFYWVPEFDGFPGATFLLTQLSPLAAKGLTTQGQSLVPIQDGRSGLVAGFLLLAALAIPPLARARFWLARLLLVPLFYLAAIGGLVTLLTTLVRGQLGVTLLGLALMLVWIVTAAVFWYVTLASLHRWARSARSRRVVATLRAYHAVPVVAWIALVAVLVVVRFWDYWRTLI